MRYPNIEMPGTKTFTHDCERCVYLGHHDGLDVYYCPVSAAASGILGGTVVARYGNEGHEYASTDVCSLGPAKQRRLASEAYKDYRPAKAFLWATAHPIIAAILRRMTEERRGKRYCPEHGRVPVIEQAGGWEVCSYCEGIVIEEEW